MDVESVSEELYGLPLPEFTPTRTDREKQAKAAGDKDLAAQIRRLAKPSLVAWLANQLARQHADEIRFWLQLGPALREATATGSGSHLRELSRQQSKVVYALVQQARRLASAAGHKVSQDTARGLEDTLRAALADPEAAEALAAGRLTEGMQNSGLGSPTKGFGGPRRNGSPAGSGQEPTAATATAPKGTSKSPARAQDAGEQPADEVALAKQEAEQARGEVEQATSAAETVTTAHEKAVAQLETADQTVVDAEDRVGRLNRELDEARRAQSRAQDDQSRAQAALARVNGEARNAQQHLDSSTRRLAEATKRLDDVMQ